MNMAELEILKAELAALSQVVANIKKRLALLQAHEPAPRRRDNVLRLVH
jgi:hypothetical protein